MNNSNSDTIPTTTPTMGKFLKWVELHNKVVTLGLGTSILLYGSHAPTVVLLICAARASGIENTRKNIILLFESFANTSKALRDAQPEFTESLKQLSVLKKEAIFLSQKYQEGIITIEDHSKEKTRIDKDMAILNKVGTKMSVTVYQIVQSIDFNKLENVLHSMLMSMASVIAVQSSEHALLLSHAMTIGSQLSHIVYEVSSKYFNFEMIPEGHENSSNSRSSSSNNTSNYLSTSTLSQEEINRRQAWRTLANISGHITAMITTYIFRKISFIITSCSLGAELVTTAVQQIVDPYLSDNNLPKIKDMTIYNINPANGLHMMLFSYGLLQITHRSSLLERLLLMPLTTIETLLSVFLVVKKM